MHIEQDVKLDFKDVLIRPKRSTLKSRAQVELKRTYAFKYAKTQWEGVPVIAANMDHVGTFETALALSSHHLMTAVHKFTTSKDWQGFAEKHPDALKSVFVTSGIGESDIESLREILSSVPCGFICLDVANGYTQAFVDALGRTRELFPHHVIMAGNVVTAEMTEELILRGADIVKIGIGPGSVCTTRRQTGVGYPQLSAIIECADAAHGLGGLVCADGGCTSAGDVAKAFGAGADFVMLGGMFAGHDESAGEVIEQDGRKFKKFYGMSSEEAMKRHAGGVASYRAPEGKSVLIPYRGPIEQTASEILGGLRSACTYVGAGRLKELSKRTTFIRVTQQLNEVFTPFEAR